MGLTRRATLLAGVAAASGCSLTRDHAPPGVRPVAAWDAQLSVRTDAYTKATTITGPWHSRGQAEARFMAFVRPSRVTYALQARVASNGWLFLDTAYDHTGTAYQLSRDDGTVDWCQALLGCTVTEYVSLSLTERYVTERHDTGLDFKLFGKRGTAFVFIPAEYLSAVIQRTARQPCC
jgi:hypothetical protein